MSLHDLLFDLPVDDTTRRRKSPFSSTLVLTGLNVYEGLGIDDPEKAKWRDYVFHARGRDLKGAIFFGANLTKVDFEGAELQGAMIESAQLIGASLRFAQLQGADLAAAQLMGASLESAQLQGAELGWAQLQGALLDRAQLQGAPLNNAQLQGAVLDWAQLQGTSLYDAQLQGASLVRAQLQGAALQQASFQATDLSQALLWRTNRAADSRWTASPVELSAVRLPDSREQWLPSWRDNKLPRRDEKDEVHPWNDKTYQDLRKMVEALPPGRLHDQALDRIRSLDCANPDPTLSSCDPNSSVSPPAEAAKWQKALQDARADDSDYPKALAAELKALVCSGGGNAAYVLRGLLSQKFFTRT